MEEEKNKKNNSDGKSSVDQSSNSKEQEERGPQRMKEEEIDKLKEEIESLKKKCQEYLDGWKRERADFLNYKKEEFERVEGIIRYANENLILKLLPIVDNFYLAEASIPLALKEDKWIEGFLQIKKQILDFLKKEGVERIKTVGEKFDPRFMEAVEEKEGEEEGIVVEEVQAGYTLYGKLIRPAKVRVGK